ncbi:MAG TPA: hypothetical protein VHG91_04215 [Longimicrobium sp.]|nr:hypothetical protein [Longimicrobium sp.]
MSEAGGTPPGTRLLLRAMVEVGSAAEAGMEARRIAARVAPFAEVARSTAARYEKVPYYWEVTLYLRPAAGSARALFERLRSEAAAGWTAGAGHDDDDDGRWAVWNAVPGAQLLSPRVRWAELQLLPEDRGGPEAG